MKTPVNPDKLRKALDRNPWFVAPNRAQRNEEAYKQWVADIKLLLGAVQAVLDGAEIWWCETHHAEDDTDPEWISEGRVCWEETHHGMAQPTNCSMVLARVVLGLIATPH